MTIHTYDVYVYSPEGRTVPAGGLLPGRVALVLRTNGVEEIPGLRAGDEDVVLRPEPGRIVQARCRDPDPGRPLLRLTPGDPGPALRAEAALVPSHPVARREVMTESAAYQPERLRRHQHDGRVRPPRDLLALAAMTVEHHDRRG